MFSRKLRLVLLVAASQFLYCPAGQAANYVKAKTLYAQKKFREAAVEFQDCKKSWPNNTLVRYYLALSAQQVGDLNTAREEYQWVANNGDMAFRARAKQGYDQLSRLKAQSVSGSSAAPLASSASASSANSRERVSTILEFYTDT
ncbi:MAG TPA: hypothetical protein PKD05_13425 [Candidatus Melainabacteria bacterium]|nr:hypothetical protein [Candidatus Melainabacteria bacterium]